MDLHERCTDERAKALSPFIRGVRFKGDRIRVRGLTRLRYQLAKNWHG